MLKKTETVDQYLKIGCGRCSFGGTPQCKVHTWTNALEQLRTILNQSELNEEIKWSAPCYTYSGKNILMLSALKESVVVSFFRGAELKDEENLLEKPGENSRISRYLRFTDPKKIQSLRPAILNFVQEAIELAKSDRKPTTGNEPELEYPEELIRIFEENSNFEEAFSSLTPGRKRGYLLHFTSAKQSKTKIARIKKCMPRINDGMGLNER